MLSPRGQLCGHCYGTFQGLLQPIHRGCVPDADPFGTRSPGGRLHRVRRSSGHNHPHTIAGSVGSIRHMAVDPLLHGRRAVLRPYLRRPATFSRHLVCEYVALRLLCHRFRHRRSNELALSIWIQEGDCDTRVRPRRRLDNSVGIAATPRPAIRHNNVYIAFVLVKEAFPIEDGAPVPVSPGPLRQLSQPANWPRSGTLSLTSVVARARREDD